MAFYLQKNFFIRLRLVFNYFNVKFNLKAIKKLCPKNNKVSILRREI